MIKIPVLKALVILISVVGRGEEKQKKRAILLGRVLFSTKNPSSKNLGPVRTTLIMLC